MIIHNLGLNSTINIDQGRRDKGKIYKKMHYSLQINDFKDQIIYIRTWHSVFNTIVIQTHALIYVFLILYRLLHSEHIALQHFRCKNIKLYSKTPYLVHIFITISDTAIIIIARI